MSTIGGRSSTFFAKADVSRPDRELRQLRSALDDDMILTHAHSIATRMMGRPVTPSSSVLARGTFHDVVIVTFNDDSLPQRVAVRLWRHPEWGTDEGMLLETHVRPWLEAAGVLAPTIIGTDLTRTVIPTDVQVSSVALGTSLRDVDHDDRLIQPMLVPVAVALSQLSQVQASGAGPIDLGRSDGLVGIHGSLADFLTVQLESHVAMCVREGCVTAKEADLIARLFDSLSAVIDARPRTLLHGDPGNHNIFVDSDAVAPEAVLIDWEDARIGDPMLDLANWATFHPERRWPLFFEAANEQGPYSERSDVRALFWLYYLRMALAKTVYRIRFGVADKPGRPPAATRIQRALEGLREHESSLPIAGGVGA